MRRILLKRLSFEKQMTVLLPTVMLVLLLFGVLVVSRSRERAAVDPGESTAATRASSSDTGAVNILVLLHGETLHHLTLVGIHPDADHIAVSSMALDLSLPAGTAAEVYESGGAPSLQAELEKRLAVPLDFYVDLSYDGLRKLLEYIGGGVTVTLPQAVSRVDEAGLSVSFPAGELHLFAYPVYELMQAVAAEPPEVSLPTATSLWCGVAERLLAADRQPVRDFSALANAADTNIKIFHLESYRSALQAVMTRRLLAVAVGDVMTEKDLTAWRLIWTSRNS